MKNTEFSINDLSSFLSMDASFQTLKEMIEDFEREVDSVISAR